MTVGRHDQCAELRVEHPATYITRADGLVPYLPGAGLTPAWVWEVGHRHVSGCPCLPTHERQGVLDLLEVGA